MEKNKLLKTIESKGFNKILWNKAGKAMHNYNMINPGDKIAVGISGGKDSITLFNILARIKEIVDFDFNIYPVYVSYSNNIYQIENVKKYIGDLGYELIIKTTNINKIVFEDRNEKNPCALCSRLRRGILYSLMKEMNINKLALGHNLDDIIETFMMNFFYQGNINKMLPKYTSEEYGFEIIRPMSYIEENTIVKYAKKLNLPILKQECPFAENKNSKRKKMKEIIDILEKDNKEIRCAAKNALNL